VAAAAAAAAAAARGEGLGGGPGGGAPSGAPGAAAAARARLGELAARLEALAVEEAGMEAAGRAAGEGALVTLHLRREGRAGAPKSTSTTFDDFDVALTPRPAHDQLRPVPLFPLLLAAGRPGVRAVACGADHALAVLAGEGALWAWGGNARGQLGLGDRASRFVPCRVSLDGAVPPGVSAAAVRVAAFDAGADYSLAVLAWGDGAGGGEGENGSKGGAAGARGALAGAEARGTALGGWGSNAPPPFPPRTK